MKLFPFCYKYLTYIKNWYKKFAIMQMILLNIIQIIINLIDRDVIPKP